MSAQIAVKTIGFHHHRHRVPAHDGAQFFFDFQITGAMFALISRNGIHISCIAGERDLRATAACQISHALHQVVSALRTFIFYHGFERIEPFTRFHHIWIIDGLRQNLVYLG